MASLALVLVSLWVTNLFNNTTLSIDIWRRVLKRSRCRDRCPTKKEPWNWSSDLVHIPSDPARTMAMSKSTKWTTTLSPTKPQALRTRHTTTYEACKGWVKSSNSPETSASSLSLLLSLLRLLLGRSASSSSLRHSLMEDEQGLFGAPCGVGLVSRRFILAWYVCSRPDFTYLGEYLCRI